MNNLTRTDTLFGRRVNMVGNISADLVLESLGKIYIKSRNKSLTLEEVITSLVMQDPNTSTSRCKVVEGIEGLDTSEFKNGTFVFDKLSNILYLFIDDELLELINVAPEGTGFVKRSGDTMTGRLAIYVKNGPPLYVNSSDLVQNLNAQYLNGETAEEFTRRNADEKIGGEWTFLRPTTFESGVLFYKDIITHGSIGTPSFSSGFGGYGWRMDADTNTLTVDNLVVRKLMRVYELVVNKISATNGSLWVTNAGKVTSVIKLQIKTPDFFNTSSSEYKKFAGGLKQGDAFIKTGTVTIRDFSENDQDPNEPFMTASGNGVQIKLDCWTVNSLKAAKLIMPIKKGVDYSLQTFDTENPLDYNEVPLFDTDFKFDCTFPIVTDEGYITYKRAKDLLIDAYKELLVLQGLSEPTSEQSQLISLLLAQINGQGNTEGLKSTTNPYKYIKYVLPYYKYFAKGDYYLVGFDSDELPVFKPGDLLRCQKWTYNGIKYYDAIVCNLIDTRYVIQLADSMLDKKTTINYNSSLEPEVTIHEEEENTNLYNTSKRNSNPMDDPIGIVEEKDGLVQMGHLWNSQRQNAVYITSTDDGAPFMDVLSGINRPDFSVIYYTPIFQTIKLYAKAKGPRRFRESGQLLNDKVEGISATKEYYVLRDGTTSGDYTYIKVTGNDETDYYMVKGYHPAIQCADNGYSCTILNYLNLSPDKNTELILESTKRYLLLENGAHLDVGTYVLSNVPTEGKHFLLESISDKFQLASTRTTRARLGNLEGILDEMFPLDKLPYGYGLYGQNVFLTGEFYLSNGTAVADIGKDAITFAIAGLTALENSIVLLRQDTEAAYNLLKSNVYSKGLLRTAGMVVRGGDNPGIVMWGNSIIIATTKEELYGLAEPTALFNNGKIRAKFLEIHDAYSDEVYQYESIPQQHKLELSNRKWTEINYSASGTNLSNTSPSTSGGVKIYTYKSNGKDVTLYVRLFTIHSLRTNISDYAVLNNKYNDSESEYYVTPEGPYDAWLVVNLDGDIPDISNLQYATFLINDVEYSGDSRDPNKVFNVNSEDFDKVLKNVTLWSLRADGTGNLGGRSVFWNTLGDLSVIGSLNSARGSFAKFLYYKNDIYSLLDPGYAGEYPKFLIHNDKLSAALLLVEYESASFDSGYLIQLGYSRLNANQLHILKGYDDYINLSNNEGVLYEKNSITMGVLYPLLNLMIIPYRSDKLKFFVICNYVPLITKIDVYYLVAGTYYIALNCNPDFEVFILNNYLTGNILTCISGINNMYGGLGYFRNESQRVVANLAGLNIGYTFNFGESSSSNYIYVGGSENWWYIEAKRKKEIEDNGSSSENIHDITATSLGHKQVKLDNHIIAFKIETINEDKHTEGGFSFQLNYNSFADKIIKYVPPMSNDNYEEDVLLKWVKEPYTSQLGNFKLRYITICGNENTEDTLHYYIKFMNQAILEHNASASTIQLPVLTESSSGLQLLDNVIMDITNEDLRLPNSYIDSLKDSRGSSSSNILTVSGRVSDRSAYLYSFLWNDGTLLNTEDYTREKTLTGLSPITYIDPQLSSFKSSGSVTLQQGAQLLRSFVERECEYIDKYLLFLDKLRFNIQNSKTPDISVSTVYISADRSTGTKSFTVTANSNINWTVSTDSNWCFAGVVSSGGLLVSNGSGNLTVEIRYYVNNDYNSRTSIITIQGGDTSVRVTFVQEAKTYKEYTLSVSPSSISAPASGGSYTLNVTSNDRWTITAGPINWLTFTPTIGDGNGTISVQVASGSTSRSHSITIMMIDDYSKTVSFTVNQAGSGSEEESGGDLGTYQYSVGLISDLHLNTDNNTASTDDQCGDEADLTNALNTFKSQGVEFICASGDIIETFNPWETDTNSEAATYGDNRTLADAKNFYNTYTAANSGLNFYSPLGNHDYLGLYEKRAANEDNVTASRLRVQSIWAQYVQSSYVMGSSSVNYLSNSDNLTYYFTKGDDIYVMLSLDYGGDNEGIVTENGTYTFTGSNYRDTINAKKIISLPSNDSDVNAILSYINDTGYSSSDLPYNYQFYSPSSLIWLKNLILSNTDKKIFVFTHHFLPHKTGNSSGIPSNDIYSYATIYSKNSHTTTKDPTTKIAYDVRRGADTLSGMLFWFINKLNNTYKNVYWFSGHSHLTWDHNSGDELKCAHIDNHDYSIVSPASNVYDSNSNTDSLAGKIYTKSSMTSNGNSGWWIALPSLSKPRKISGSNVTVLMAESELSIMDVYTNGIKIKGYKTKRANSSYNLEKLVEKSLLMDGTEAGSEESPSTEVTYNSSDADILKEAARYTIYEANPLTWSSGPYIEITVVNNTNKHLLINGIFKFTIDGTEYKPSYREAIPENSVIAAAQTLPKMEEWNTSNGVHYYTGHHYYGATADLPTNFAILKNGGSMVFKCIPDINNSYSSLSIGTGSTISKWSMASSTFTTKQDGSFDLLLHNSAVFDTKDGSVSITSANSSAVSITITITNNDNHYLLDENTEFGNTMYRAYDKLNEETQKHSKTFVVYNLYYHKGSDSPELSTNDLIFNLMLNSFGTAVYGDSNAFLNKTTTNTYLRTMFDLADDEWDENITDSLFNPDLYFEPAPYRSSSTTGDLETYKAMQAWLMATCLAELIPTSGTTTNNLTKLFKCAYDNYGNNDLYKVGSADDSGTIIKENNYGIKQDATIARYVASMVYALNHDYHIDTIDQCRTELGGSVISVDIDADLNYSSISNIGYFVDGDLIFGPPPGPYTTTQDETHRNYQPPKEKPSGQLYFGDNNTHDWYNYNYKMDVAIDKYVTEYYNCYTSDPYMLGNSSDVIDNSNRTDANNTVFTDNSHDINLIIVDAGIIPGAEDFMWHGKKKLKYTGILRTEFKYPGGNDFIHMHNFDLASANETGNNVFEYVGPYYIESEPNLWYRNPSIYTLVSGENIQGEQTEYMTFMCKIRGIADDHRQTSYGHEYGRRRPLGGLTDGTTRRNNRQDSPLNGINKHLAARFCSDTRTKYNNITQIYKNPSDPYDSGMYADDFPHDRPASWPSGHASLTWGPALYIFLMFGDRSTTAMNVLKRSYRFGSLRSIGRFHWNSDILYGRLYACMLLPLLNANDKFLGLYDEIKSILHKWNVKIIIKNMTGLAIQSTGEIKIYVTGHYGMNVDLPGAYVTAGALYTWNVGENEYNTYLFGNGLYHPDYAGNYLATEVKVYNLDHYSNADAGLNPILDTSDSRCDSVLKNNGTYVIKINAT